MRLIYSCGSFHQAATHRFAGCFLRKWQGCFYFGTEIKAYQKYFRFIRFNCLSKLFKRWQFLLRRATPGSPEIDDIGCIATLIDPVFQLVDVYRSDMLA